jgi:hypothetical protein
MKRICKRILSLILSCAVLVAALPSVAFDVGEKIPPETITAFEALPYNFNTVLVGIGEVTSEEDLRLRYFPQVLNVTLLNLENQEPREPQAVQADQADREIRVIRGAQETSVDVTWVCDGGFDPNTAGTYLFRSVLVEPESYILAEGVVMPELTVNVYDPAALQAEPGDTEEPDGAEQSDGAEETGEEQTDDTEFEAAAVHEYTGGDITLNNGDTLRYNAGDTYGTITVPDNAKVTLNFYYKPSKSSATTSRLYVGDNTHIVFTFEQEQYNGDLYFPIYIGGQSITLECTTDRFKLNSLYTSYNVSSDDGYNFPHYLSLETTPAKSVTLIGEGSNGITLEDSLETEQLIIRGGVHSINLEDVYWKYESNQSFYQDSFGSPIDGRHALTLLDNGSLTIESGTLTLKGMSNGWERYGYGSYYGMEDYHQHKVEEFKPLAAGAGLRALGNATVNIAAGATLEIIGGDQKSPVVNYVFSSDGAGRIDYKNIYGGPATLGDVSINFAEVSGDTRSFLYMKNGVRYTADGLALDTPVDGYDDPWIIGDSSVTVNKPAGNYFAGANWSVTDGEAYRDACASATQQNITVTPKDSSATSATTGSLTLSTTPPSVLNFSAVQVGGAAGTAETQYIDVTFDQEVAAFTQYQVSLTNATVGAPAIIDGDSTKWRIPVTSITGEGGTVASTLQISGISGYTFVAPSEQAINLFKTVLLTRTFEAAQIGGVSGVSDTQYIALKFSDVVDRLSIDDIILTGSDGNQVELTALEDSVEQDPSDGSLWMLEKGYMENGQEVDITFENWAGASNVYEVTGTQSVTLYTYVHPIFTYTVTQVDGVSEESDTEGFLVTFSEGFDYTLTDDQVDVDILAPDTRDQDPVDMGTITANGDSDLRTWFVPLEFSDYVIDGTSVEFTIASPDDDEYWVDLEYHSIPIYREIRQPSFTISSYGNTGIITADDDDILSFVMLFDQRVTGLTEDQVTVSEADIYSVTATYPSGSDSYTLGTPTDRWNVTLSGTSAEYDETMTVTVTDWLIFGGSSATATNKYENNEFTDSVVTLTRAAQIGGQEDEYGSYTTTEGIRLFFDKAITLTDDDVGVVGATAGSITDNGDSDGRTWYIPISGSFADGDSVTVTVGTRVTKFSGVYGQIGDDEIYVSDYEKSVVVLKSSRYTAEVNYTLEQVGGEDGITATSGLVLTITSAHDLDADDDLDIGIMTTIGAVNFPQDTYRWGGATPRYSDNGRTITYFYDYMYLNKWENGDEVRVEIEDWTDANGNYYDVITTSDAAAAKTVLYKDTRKHLTIKSAVARGEDKLYNAFYGRWNDTEIVFQLSTVYDLNGLTADKITITPTEPGTTIVKSTAADALTYDDVTSKWILKLESRGGAGYIPYELSIADFGDNYTVDNTISGAVSNDFRTPVKVINAEQVGGIIGEKESTGILLTFDKEFYDPEADEGGKQFGGFDSLDYRPYFFLSVKGAESGNYINYDVLPVEGRKDQVLLNITQHNYVGQQVFLVTAKNDEQRRSDYKGTENTVQVTLYDDPPPPDGRALNSVSPRGIFIHSVRKWIALSGEFGSDGTALETVYAREAGEEDPEKWITLPFDDIPADGALIVDVADVTMFNEGGDYEVCFEAEDEFLSEWRPVSVYDDPVYSMDGYGILAITQNSDKSFDVQGYENETEMKAEIGNDKLVLVFRGGILETNGVYQVQSETVINNALTYHDAEGNDTITVKPLGNGDVEIVATYGDLRWKNIPITLNMPSLRPYAFDMSLSADKSYAVNRGDPGDPVEITTGVNDFSVNFVIGGATLATYKLYDGICSLSGSAFLSLPKALVGALDAGVEVDELLLTEKIIPPIKASAEFSFSPGGMFGESLGAVLGEASLAFQIDTLPETRPHIFGASGTLDIVDMIYVEGEIIMAWGDIGGVMVVMPDKIELFARIGSGGIPLVPPTIVAYINGFGGGVSGLAQTVFGNFDLIPPVKLKAMGAVVDATGQLFEIEKASFEFGVGSFSAYANEAKILNFLSLEDVGYKFGVIDSEVQSIYNMPTVDAYFGFGGSASFDVSVLKIEGGMEANVMLRGNYLSDAIIGWTIESMEAGGFAVPSKEVRTALFNAIDFNGRIWASAEVNVGPLGTLAGAKGELALSKTKISGKVTGTIWPGIKKTIGVTYNLKKDKLSFDIFSAGANDGSDDMQITNIKNAGSYNPGGNPAVIQPYALSAYASPYAQAAAPPAANKDAIATLFSDEQYGSIDVYKDGELFDIITGENLHWFDTVVTEERNELKGIHSANYLITSDGAYTFKTGTPSEEFAYTLSEIMPLPEYSAVVTSSDGNSIETRWELNEAAEEAIEAAAEEASELYTRLMLVNAKTGSIVLDLTAPAASDGSYPSASDGSFTANLPTTLESGEYYISAELSRRVTEEVTLYEDTPEAENVEITGYEAISIFNSAVFEYINPESLPAPASVDVQYAGNGAFEVAWSPVVGADGYRVTILNSDGSEIDGISAYETSDGSLIVQGGVVVTEDILDSDGNVLSEGGQTVGLAFGNEYVVSVRAIKNKEFSNDGGTQTQIIPILGLEQKTNYTLRVPEIPELSVTLDGGNSISSEEDSTSYIATNDTTPKLAVTSTEAVIIEVSVNGEVTYTSTDEETSSEIELELSSDGIYNIQVTAQTDSGDSAVSGLIISLDTAAPILNVDESSFTAIGGMVRVNGFTELGATVMLNDEIIEVIGGLFEVSEQTESAVTVMRIAATDEAGNTTGRIINIPYVAAASEEEPGNSDGSDDGDGDNDNNNGNGNGDYIYYPPTVIQQAEDTPQKIESIPEFDAQFVIDGKTVKNANILNKTGSLNAKETLKNLEEVYKNAAADEQITITIKLKNGKVVSYPTFDKLAKFAEENDVKIKIYADNYVGKNLITRLYIDVQTFEKTNRNLYLLTDFAKEEAIEKKFGKWFANTVEVIAMEQTGSLKTIIEVAVKLDTITDADDLYFYYYDEETNKYRRFKTNYAVDKNGYLRFMTAKGGNIVVSEGQLTKKK